MSNLLDYINLHTGEEDKDKVLENVYSNTSFRGANLWILACAIVIASIGLNVNSTAVVIGAMLISPLMGPIVGAGFALGTFNFDLLKKSLKNLAIATIVSLMASSLYFLVSPFKDPQSEILARTAPNIYDILIAFCGGLVGVIAVTRVEKGNTVPGVAIATALMPPLCTAGYGLATGHFTFFLGAMYLYSINCVFICIATFVVVKYLKYAPHKWVNEKHQKLLRYAITFLILVLLVPSIYFAYQLFEEKKYNQSIETFIKSEFSDKGFTPIYKNAIRNRDGNTYLELAFLNKKFNDKEIASLNQKLKNYGVSNTSLRIQQDTTNIKNAILNEINSSNRLIDQKDVIINNLQQELASYRYDNAKILAEAKILFPEIENLSLANHIYYENTDSVQQIPVMIYSSTKKLDIVMQEKLVEWLQQKLDKPKLELYRKEIPEAKDNKEKK